MFFNAKKRLIMKECFILNKNFTVIRVKLKLY